VVMVPVGGRYTIDVPQVDRLTEQLGAKIVIPMHYKTQHTGSLRISGVEPFLAGKSHVRRLKGSSATIAKETLPKQRTVWVFKTPGT